MCHICNSGIRAALATTTGELMEGACGNVCLPASLMPALASIVVCAAPYKLPTFPLTDPTDACVCHAGPGRSS